MTEKEALIAISTFIPFGPARINLLISYFGSASKVWMAHSKELINLGLGENKTTMFLTHRQRFDLNQYLVRLEENKIEVVTQDESTYPKSLNEIDSKPILLYFKGHIENLDPAVAIVGARKMTSYGKEVAMKFARDLASLGVTIVSGLARGIDTYAHMGALSAHGRTVAVLGCGLDVVYPRENSRLAGDIIKESGALVSEYPLGFPSFKANFAVRNRIISGLARGVVVVEGTRRSGALHTASAAAEQGRTVFAVPGQISSPNSQAPFFLLKNGAKLAISSEDILDELGMEIKVDRQLMESVLPTSSEEEKILEILELEPKYLDDIVRISSLGVSNISARLTIMELKGLVKNMGRGLYKKC